MPQFIATTSKGLVDVVHDELVRLGATGLAKQPGAVVFEGNWAMAYRANLELRAATRVLKPILRFPAYKNEDLYFNIQKFDFTRTIEVTQSFAVDATVRDSVFTDQRFVAMKVKDAIADQFRDRTDGKRPDVSLDDPDLTVVVRIYKNQVSVALDLSGEALFKRGYRVGAGEAPLKEHLAAGLLMLAGFDSEKPMPVLVDPMCGSGTLLIEAALMSRGIAPGTLRKGFAMMRWKGFQEDRFKEEMDRALAHETEAGSAAEGPIFFGYDVDSKVLQLARQNAKRAGVEDLIHFERRPMETLTAPSGVTDGWVVTNPPYGTRLGHKESAKDIFRDLAFTLKNRFKGWSAFVLSGDPELSAAMKLKASRKYPVMNGPIECRWLRYDLF